MIKAGKTWWQDEALLRGSEAVTVFAFKASLAWLWHRLTTVAETLWQVSMAAWHKRSLPYTSLGGAQSGTCPKPLSVLPFHCVRHLIFWEAAPFNWIARLLYICVYVCVTQYSIHLISVVLRNGPECLYWCHFL